MKYSRNISATALDVSRALDSLGDEVERAAIKARAPFAPVIRGALSSAFARALSEVVVDCDVVFFVEIDGSTLAVGVQTLRMIEPVVKACEVVSVVVPADEFEKIVSESTTDREFFSRLSAYRVDEGAVAVPVYGGVVGEA